MVDREQRDDLVSATRLEFAARVKQRREQLELTVRGLSDTTGINVSYISDLESGDINPPLEVMAALARALDVELRYFFADLPTVDA